MKKKNKLSLIWGFAAVGVAAGMGIPTAVILTLKDKVNLNFQIEIPKTQLEQILSNNNFAKDYINNNIINQSDVKVDSVTNITISNNNNNLELIVDANVNGSPEKITVTVTNHYLLNKNDVVANIQNHFSKLDNISNINNDQILSILNQAYNKLNEENIKNANIQQSNPPYNDDLKTQFDLTLNTNDNWWFIDNKNNISDNLSINLSTNHNHDIEFGDLSKYFNEYNTLNKLENLLNSSDELKTILDPEFSNTLESVKWDNKFYNNNDNLSFDLELNFLNGTSKVVRIESGIKVISFNKDGYSEYLKTNVNDESQLIGNSLCDILSKFLVLNGQSFDSTIFVTNSTSAINTNKLENNNGFDCYLYNTNFEINDSGYCFLVGTNAQLTNPENLENLVTYIRGPIQIDNTFETNLKNELQNITIENYTNYFENANNLPEKDNSGRMTIDKFAEITGLPKDAIKENSIKFNKTSNTENGYLNVEISFELNDPYNYNGNKFVNIQNVTTGIYDPNSDYNINLFTYFDDTKQHLTGVTSEGDQLKVVYLPYNVKYLNSPADYFGSHLLSCTKFVGSYSSLIKFNIDSTFAGSKINEFYFENLPNFEGFPGKLNTFYKASATYISFENCPKFNFENINGNRNKGAFYLASNLETLNFKGCTGLTWLGQDFAKQTNSLKYLYLNDSPITSVDNSAFYDVQYFKNVVQIYVLNGTAKSAIYNSLSRQAGFKDSQFEWYFTN